MQPQILIIAGPNGAGKTTFAREYLQAFKQPIDFINADLIAAGLNPMRPEQAAVAAGRLMLEEIDRRVMRQDSFAIETTLSGLVYARRIPGWRSIGYKVRLIFLRIESIELAKQRVAQRVLSGGHDIPAHVIQRRHRKGWHNLHAIYKDLVDEWLVFDNAGNEPQLIGASG